MNSNNFEKFERIILSQVMETSKALIETFKFNMIYHSQVDKKQMTKTLNGLKKFRKTNWDKSLSREEAYQRYLNLY